MNRTETECHIRYSIIIPHYNIPHLLERCVNSIPEREDIQVIVSDDCSPNVSIYIQQYAFLKRSNVEFYICDRNGGGGYARNEGLKHAKGKWILFADADDFFIKGFEEILDTNYDDDADVIYFNIQSVYSDDVSKTAERHTSKHNLFAAYRKTGDPTPFRYAYCEPWGKMVKRDFINKNSIKFDEVRVANDYYFSVVSGCLAKNIKVVDKPLYVLTCRENSVSHNFADSTEKLLVRLDVYTRVQLFLEEHGYTLHPMPVRGLMVILLKKDIRLFVVQLRKLHHEGVSVRTLIAQMLNRKYMK